MVASGGLSTGLRVESKPVEQRFEIPLGKLREGVVPTFLAVGIAPGQVTSAPMGSLWGTFLNSETAFDVAALLAAPDEVSRRTGLARTGAAGDESGDPVRIPRRHGGRAIRRRRPLSRHTLLRPLAKVLARIATEPGPADIRADAARFLAYSDAEGAVDVLRALADDRDPQVHEAAAIGLTFLGQTDHLETVRSIVGRADEPPRVPRWQRVRLVEEDPLIALARQHSDAAIDILGAALLGDLKSLSVVDAGDAAGPARR